MRVDDLDATVKMLLYTDETYTNAIVSSPVIELREKVGNLVIGGTKCYILFLKKNSLYICFS